VGWDTGAFVIRLLRSVVVCLLLSALAAFAQLPQTMSQQPYPGIITVSVDASAAPTKLFHSKLTIPVKPGALTLLYPKWIPGEHGPTGPIIDLTGLKFSGNGQPIPWRRDDVEMYAIHLTVPDGVTTLEATLDYTSPAGAGIYTSGGTASDKLAVVSWNQLLLYPAGYRADQITCKADLKVPAGWQIGTALPMASGGGESFSFKPTSLYTLVDSPVITGANYRVLRLTPPGANPPVEMDMAGDSPASLRFSPELENHLRQIPAEALALFGGTHYRDYHFLFSMSDHVAHFGLEHHESNDTRVPERTMTDSEYYDSMSGVIPHEYVHSWNGKYRRPAGLNTPDYEEPMKGSLLWVYEGLTEYLGDVLMARSGMWTPDRYRQNLAIVAAELDNQSGRTWRPLLDTAVSVQTLNDAPKEWENWRRALDYYDEGELIWLEADMQIRQLTKGQKSFDDFAHAFYGQPSLGSSEVPGPKPYTFEDVVSTLNQVAPFDWAKFLNDRLTSTSPRAPLGGIENSGWRLVYTDQPPPVLKAHEATRQYVDVGYSLGLTLKSMSGEEGEIIDSYFGKPAANAGITPGMKVIAVNGRRYNEYVLHSAIKESKDTKEPIELLVQNSDYFKTYKLDYHDGERYPLLQRNEKPDTLSDIIKPHASK
jgi:predicted metalloprotease with PDZ domain